MEDNNKESAGLVKSKKTGILRLDKDHRSSLPILLFIGILVILATLSYALLLEKGQIEIFKELRSDIQSGNFSPYAEVKSNGLAYRPTIQYYQVISNLIGAFSIISALIVLVFALLYNYNKNKRVPLIENFNKLSIEVRYLLIPFFIFTILSIGLYIVPFELLMYNEIELQFIKAIFEPYDSLLYPFLVIVIAYPILLYIFLAVFSIKGILIEGIVNTFFTKSLLGRLILWINTYIRRFIDKVLSIKLKGNLLFIGLYGIFLFTLLFSWPRNFYTFVSSLVGIFLVFVLRRLVNGIKKLENDAFAIQNGDYSKEVETSVPSLVGLSISLNKISEGLEIALDRELRSQKTKTELITNVSHDLKTPLTGIINYSDLLTKDDISSDKQREYAEIILEKAMRLKLLIEDLFEISKAQSGDVELHLEKLNIIELFHQSLGEMEEKLSEKDLKVIINMSDEKIYSILDGRRTHRIFENVLSNIAKYSMEGTRVYIDSKIKNKQISFTFKNISEYEMNFKSEDLFERSFRGDKSRSSDGSGLGLGIAKNLIELQKGNIDISIDGDLFKLELKFPIIVENYEEEDKIILE